MRKHYIQHQDDCVTLYLNAPDAQVVQFASSLDGYVLHEAKRVGKRWAVSMPGNKTFKYFYMIDDVFWEPLCFLSEKDDFGSENCIYMAPALEEVTL